MLKNYFTIALRTLIRNKVYSFINVLGLGLGVCSCLAIWLIVHYEFSFDKFHPDKDRIYRINSYEQFSKEEPAISRPSVLPVLPAAMRANVPGLDVVAPYHILEDATVSIPQDGKLKPALPSTPIVTGPEYFSVLKYTWLAGDEATVLSTPYKLVLTAKKAHIYFGPGSLDQMIGRELLYNDSLRVSVAGIVKDWEANTDFPYTEFISLSTADNTFLRETLQLDGGKGIPYSSRVLLKLKKDASPEHVEASLTNLFNKNWRSTLMPRVALQSLADIHFSDSGRSGEIRMAHLPTLYALIIIALFILLLAIINYVNLATAQSITRDKEIGIRKVLGGSRLSLVIQFLSETFLLTLLAVGLASFMVTPVLSLFRSFIPANVQFHILDPVTITFLLSITVITSLLAGLYPASALSSYIPVLSLKGVGARKGSEKWWLRKGLIVFQFTISLIFIVGTLVIGRQIRFMMHTDLGFTSDAIVTFSADDRDHLDKVRLLEEKVAQLPGVLGVARENMPPMGMDKGFFQIQYNGGEPIPVAAIKADEKFIPLYGIRLVAGRNILPGDTLKEFLINESLAKMLGFKSPGQALGHTVFTWNKSVPIVGVFADFHQASFHEAIKPQIITSIACTDIAVKLDTKGRPANEVRSLLARIEQQWKEFYPHTPFEYSFLDESIAQLYKKEQTTAWLMNIATGITIFISCLGLFGLTMFTAEKRTKEIAIRKVLGASISNISMMLINDFVVLIVLALFLATPIAWLSMDKWLQDFVYRVPISWWIFALAGVGAIFIALITICFHALKAALANPVKSLRAE